MTVKFYTDEHILAEASKQLKAKGIDIITAQDEENIQKDDMLHLAYATDLDRIIITCDKGFEVWSIKFQQHRPHGGIIIFNATSCRSVGDIVRSIQELHDLVEGGAAIYEEDLYNKIVRL